MEKLKSTPSRKQNFRLPRKEYASLRRLQPEIQLKHSRANVIRHAYLYLQWLKVGVAIVGSQVSPEDKNYIELKQLFKTRWFNWSSCNDHYHCQQQNSCLSRAQHSKVGSVEADGTSSTNSDPDISVSFRTLNSENKRACGNHVDRIDRKYNQRKDIKQERNYYTRDAADANKGRSWRPPGVDPNVENDDGFTPNEKFQSPGVPRVKQKTEEVRSRDVLKLDFISSSPCFKKLHDLYLENRSCSLDRLVLPSRTVASSDKSRGCPRHRYDGVDPMWAQYIPVSSSPPSHSVASTVDDFDSSIFSSALLRSPCYQRGRRDFLTSPFKGSENRCDQDTSPLKSVLAMNFFGSPSSKSISLSPGTPHSRVYGISQDESCSFDIGYQSVAPLSPWNTGKFVPYSPSLFSVRASLLSGITSVDEKNETVFFSPQGIELMSRYPSQSHRIWPAKTNRAGESKHN
ncbi:uncharacterized protein [Panulirus ornatus]|uniref:uncharacterized protein n=1 Tax=Panulirus ornatus TaxID=150431 RepID=UPI003A87F7D9